MMTAERSPALASTRHEIVNVSDEGISFPTFEGAATAHAAVMAADPTHNLVYPTSEARNGIGTTLLAELYRPDKEEPRVFDGENMTTIVQALEKAKASKFEFHQKLIAEKMLNIVFADILPKAVEYAEHPITIDRPQVITETIVTETPPLESQGPTIIDGEVVHGHMAIPTRQLLTAMNAVRDFGGKGKRASRTLEKLDRHLLRSSDETVPYVSWEHEAHIIYRSLRKAADRGQTAHDLEAARLLESASTNMGVPEKVPDIWIDPQATKRFRLLLASLLEPIHRNSIQTESSDDQVAGTRN